MACAAAIFFFWLMVVKCTFCALEIQANMFLTNWWRWWFSMVEIFRSLLHFSFMIGAIDDRPTTNGLCAQHDRSNQNTVEQNWFRHVSITLKLTFHSRKQSTFLCISHPPKKKQNAEKEQSHTCLCNKICERHILYEMVVVHRVWLIPWCYYCML